MGTKVRDKHTQMWSLKQKDDDGEVVLAHSSGKDRVFLDDQEDGEAVIITWDTVKALNKQRKRVRRLQRACPEQ